MSPIQQCIRNKDTKIQSIWIMRQAGRYLPEFRKIREKNSNFIDLCLNENLVPEITLQPLKRFDFDAAIIFSDILMVPYGLNQNVEFEKGYGPKLGELNLDLMEDIKDEYFIRRLSPIYKAIEKVKKSNLIIKKDLIGFIGAPWTVLFYMLNKKSPKKEINFNKFLNDEIMIKKLIAILEKFLKIHIKKQVDSGATIIQIFDSWAGLLNDKQLNELVYKPTRKLVDYTKSLGVPVICFPRGIKDYKRFEEETNPNVINIDYMVDPNQISKDISCVVQGGLDPNFLLMEKSDMKKEVIKYLKIFEDRPYIFNLGHGVLPETNPEMVDHLVNLVKDYGK